MRLADLDNGLAVKASGFTRILVDLTTHKPSSSPALAAKVGFVLSAAEQKKLEDLKNSINNASKTVQSGSRIVAASLGAVALGLAIGAVARVKK